MAYLGTFILLSGVIEAFFWYFNVDPTVTVFFHFSEVFFNLERSCDIDFRSRLYFEISSTDLEIFKTKPLWGFLIFFKQSENDVYNNENQPQPILTKTVEPSKAHKGHLHNPICYGYS